MLDSYVKNSSSIDKIEKEDLIKKDKRSMKSLRDWRQALRNPHVYRVGNSTFHIQRQFLAILMIVVIVSAVFYAYPTMWGLLASRQPHYDASPSCHYYKYNRTYPITTPTRTKTGISFRIAIISDLDHDSKSPDAPYTWFSIMKKGTLLWREQNSFISVQWDDKDTVLKSSLGMKGRGMELSELVTFDGKLLAFDDRTGMVYSIENDQVYPWVILMDGNGKNSKGKERIQVPHSRLLIYVC